MAQQCLDIADEVPVQAPWSFGPIPPGDFRAPSYQESVAIGLDWAVQWTLDNPDRPIIVGGYSQGGECASRYRMEFEEGGRLAHLRSNMVAGYIFGNPSRHLKKTFHGGPDTDGEGIAQFRLPPFGDEWCELIDTGDMYGGVPTTLTGEIMRDVYTLCIEMEMHSGAAEFARTFAFNCIEVVGNLDGDAYNTTQRQAEALQADFTGATRLDTSIIESRLGDNEDRFVTAKGLAAALDAAIRALVFFCQGTAPHIEYHIRQVFPGQTYVQLAVQHVRHWAAVVGA